MLLFWDKVTTSIVVLYLQGTYMGIGFGLRFKVNKHFQTNICLDFSFGTDSKGFYFSGTETF